MTHPFTQYDQTQAALAHIRTLSPLVPQIGIILGTGLGNFASVAKYPTTIPYSTIPHFPESTVEGHSGNLVLGQIADVPVAIMQGRVHAYEGYTMPQVTFPTRVLGALGCKTLIVTNASGGVEPSFSAGSLVAITDHINLTGHNAAAGPNEPQFAFQAGPAGEKTAQRFFDMSNAYSPTLRALALKEAERQGLILHQGIYLAVLGPSFETPAEIRAFRTLGADMVGMSTVHEVIVARHMGLEVLGISLVTNPAAGVSAELIDHNEVMAIGRRAEIPFTALLTALIPQLI